MSKVATRPVTVKLGEPDAGAIVAKDSNYKINLICALNWYSRERDSKAAHKYLHDWVKKNAKQYLVALETTEQDIPASYGWLARIATNGAKLGEAEIASLNKFLSSLKPKVVKDTSNKVAPTRSVQDAIKEKAATILGEIEFLFDDLKNGSDFSLKAWLIKNEIPAVYIPYIQLWLQRKMGEYVTVFKAFTAKKDALETSGFAQIKEGYSNFTTTDVKRLLNFFKDSLEETQSYGAIKKANRKPRARKSVSPSVQVKNLKYLKKFDELKLESISPVEIVGAQQLWVYNTKYRKLGVYKSDTHQGLSVKGTTIQGYVPAESMQKTLRKPEEVLKAVLGGGKIVLRKVLDNVKAKPQELNGRINAETILLRVVK